MYFITHYTELGFRVANVKKKKKVLSQDMKKHCISFSIVLEKHTNFVTLGADMVCLSSWPISHSRLSTETPSEVPGHLKGTEPSGNTQIGSKEERKEQNTEQLSRERSLEKNVMSLTVQGWEVRRELGASQKRTTKLTRNGREVESRKV